MRPVLLRQAGDLGRVGLQDVRVVLVPWQHRGCGRITARSECDLHGDAGRAGANPARWPVRALLRPDPLPVQPHLVRRPTALLQTVDRHQCVVVSGDGPGAFAETEHLYLARAVGLHPDGGVGGADVPQQRTEYESGHPDCLPSRTGPNGSAGTRRTVRRPVHRRYGGPVPTTNVNDAGDAELSDAELAAALVTSAGRLAARMRIAGLTVDRKTSISDVVSDADKAAEAMIVGRLAEVRPADGVIGEEGAAAPGRRTWVIDPVDGTFNFVSGLPAWCSALALLDGEQLLLGAIYQATTDELWVGGHDLPATRNGVPLPRMADRRLGEVATSPYLPPTRVGDLPLRDGLLRSIAGAASVRIIGSGS